MSESKKTLSAKAEKLRSRIAEKRAELDGLEIQLASTQAKLGNSPVVVISGLDRLWELALAKARNRSSKLRCRKAWNAIPVAQRPNVQTMLEALAKWNRSEEWKLENNKFVPGLHKWIGDRKWENPPEEKEAPSRYRNTPKPIPKTDDSEAVTDPAEIARLLGREIPRMNS